MSYFDFAFEAPIMRHSVGKDSTIVYTVVFLPDDLSPAPGRFRFVGELADLPVAGAFNPTADGRRYFIVSPRIRKAAAAKVGDVVEMRFRLDDEDRVDAPDDLLRAVARTKAARAAWESLSAGRKRGLAHYVDSGKTAPTREKRLAEAMAALMECEGDIRSWVSANRKKQ